MNNNPWLNFNDGLVKPLITPYHLNLGKWTHLEIEYQEMKYFGILCHLTLSYLAWASSAIFSLAVREIAISEATEKHKFSLNADVSNVTKWQVEP